MVLSLLSIRRRCGCGRRTTAASLVYSRFACSRTCSRSSAGNGTVTASFMKPCTASLISVQARTNLNGTLPRALRLSPSRSALSLQPTPKRKAPQLPAGPREVTNHDTVRLMPHHGQIEAPPTPCRSSPTGPRVVCGAASQSMQSTRHVLTADGQLPPC
jgi:hypothetical protein